jgi:hypothetical protein
MLYMALQRSRARIQERCNIRSTTASALTIKEPRRQAVSVSNMQHHAASKGSRVSPFYYAATRIDCCCCVQLQQPTQREEHKTKHTWQAQLLLAGQHNFCSGEAASHRRQQIHVSCESNLH